MNNLDRWLDELKEFIEILRRDELDEYADELEELIDEFDEIFIQELIEDIIEDYNLNYTYEG